MLHITHLRDLSFTCIMGNVFSLQMKADTDMDVFADEHMVEMNRRQGRGGGRRHSRLRSTLSRSPTPSLPTPPLSPVATPITPPTTLPPSSPLPGQPVITTLMEGKSGSLDNRESQSAQMTNGSEPNSRLPDGVVKDQQQPRNSNSKPSVADVTKNQPAPFTSSALPDDKATNNAVSSTTPPTTGSGSGPKTPLDKVQQLSRKRERTPSPTLSAGLPNSKRPAISSSASSSSSSSNSGNGSGNLLEAPSLSSTKGPGAGMKNNTKAPSPLPNARVASSASKVLTEEIQKQQGQENARLKLLIFKEIRKPGKSEHTYIMIHTYQGFPKLTKSCSHFSKILSTTADIKSRLYGK